jgi:hypothetical protein
MTRFVGSDDEIARDQFRIKGEIDQKAVRTRPRAMRPEIGDGKQCRSMHPAKSKHSAAFDRSRP